MGNDKGNQSTFLNFIKNNLWAILVAFAILMMNYGIMTTQIVQMEAEIKEVKQTVRINSVESQRLQGQRAVELAEINALMQSIANDHSRYTEEIRRLNDQLVRIYEGRFQSQNKP